MSKQDPTASPARHDPYPRHADDADRRSVLRAGLNDEASRLRAEVDAALAAQPKAPSNITRTRACLDGLEVAHDDGKGTTLRITAHDDAPGRFALAVETDFSLVEVEFPLGAATAIIQALAAVAGLGGTAPIVGHR